jgi:hypothetical protein
MNREGDNHGGQRDERDASGDHPRPIGTVRAGGLGKEVLTEHRGLARRVLRVALALRFLPRVVDETHGGGVRDVSGGVTGGRGCGATTGRVGRPIPGRRAVSTTRPRAGAGADGAAERGEAAADGADA